MNKHQISRIPAALAAGAAACLGAAANAGVIEVPASKDNTLYESPTGAISNGAGSWIFSGLTAVGEERRAVIAFDVAAAVPEGQEVVSATLRLRMSMTIVGPQPVSAHRVLADWGEGASNAGGQEGAGGPAEAGDATWIHTFFDDQFWANPGGDFDPNASAVTTVSGMGFYEWSSPGLVDDVNAWLADPSSNFGWVLINNTNQAPTAKRFDSRENNNADNRPVLILETAPPCPTDLTGDGVTDSADLNQLLAAFGATDGGDVDGDGQTNSVDLNLLLAVFGQACP